MISEFKTPQQLSQFSDNIKDILKGMMGLAIKPVSIKGKKNQVDILVNTLLQEKRFLEKYQKHGPEHPRTQAARLVLARSVKKFEDLMGIDWPLRK